MRFPSWMLAAGLALTALLAGCGGGNDNNNSGNAQVRLLNASIGYSSLDLKNGSTAINSGVAFGSTGSYTAVATDVSSVQVLAAGTTSQLATPTLSGIEKDKNYTIIAFGDTGAANSIVLSETQAAPTTAGKASVLVMNLAAGAGTVDVYMTKAGNDDITNVSPDVQVLTAGRTDTYREVDATTYRLRVTATGKKNDDLRLDVPGLALEAGKVYVLMLVSAPGSSMVNALLMPYQGSVTRLDNGIARARVVSGLPRTNSATAAINGNTLLNNVGSPVVSAYTNVTITGGANLTWAIDGVAQPAQALSLQRSKTYSVLLWGGNGTPTVSTLEEDTALPAVGNAKLRVLNGVQGLGPVSVQVNLSQVLSNVGGGQQASTTITNTTDELSFTVRAGATTIYTVSRKLVSGGIYTIYLTGSVGNIDAVLVQQ